MTDEPEAANGLSRRQLLTRGAIAGGLVWAAPVIRTTAAYATTANGTERPCTNFYMVVINPSGNAHPAPTNTNAKDVPPAIRQWFIDNPDVQVQFPAIRPLLTQTSNEAWAVLLPEVTGPNASGRQCRMVIGWGRRGTKGHRFAEGFVDPNPPLAIEVGRRLLFPCPAGGEEDCHNDGDHDEDDVGCDPDARASITASSDSPDAALDASSAGGQISSDGTSTGDAINSDGTPSRTVTSDGSPSSSHDPSSNHCLDAVYLIFCCPR